MQKCKVCNVTSPLYMVKGVRIKKNSPLSRIVICGVTYEAKHYCAAHRPHAPKRPTK